MSAYPSSKAFRNRRLLSGTTALLVVWSLSGTTEGATPLPTNPNATLGTPTITTGADSVDGVGNQTTIDLDVGNTIIEWDTFDIAADNRVHFGNGGQGGALSVLNRVVTIGQSEINGALTSDNNIAVWLLNQNGVMFGSGSTVTTGSFFASTLNMADSDFSSGTYRLRAGIDATGAADATWVADGGISLGGTITTGGTIGVAGQVITANGAMTATGGDIALIATKDVTFDFTPGSPLGIEVAAGTTLATAKVTVGASGQLTANSVVVAGTGSITDALLGIDAGATLEAVEVDGRIVLSVGNDATSATHASLTFTPAPTTTAGINVSGTLESAGDVVITGLGGIAGSGTITSDADNAGGGDITIEAGGVIAMNGSALKAGASGRTGNVALDVTPGKAVTLGAISAVELTGLGGHDADITLGAVSVTNSLDLKTDGDLSVAGITTDDGDPLTAVANATLEATGAVTVNGAVDIDGDYELTSTGGTVTIGGTQGAKGSVTLTGDRIEGSGTLTANSDNTTGVGAETLELKLNGGASNAIDMTTALKGGSNRQSDVKIDVATGQGVSVGNIDARALTGLTNHAGDIALGAVSVTDDLTIRSSTGSLSVSGVTTNDGGPGTSDASLRAETSLTVNGTVSIDGDYTLTSDNGTITIGGTQGATGAVTLTGDDIEGSGTLTSNSDNTTGITAERLKLELNNGAGNAINMTAALKGGANKQSDVDIDVDANQAVTIGDITARTLTGLGNQDASIALGKVSVTGDLNIDSDAGSVSVAGLDADDATLEGHTSLTVNGPVTVEGNYSLTATGGKITVGGTQGAKGAVTITGIGIEGSGSLTSNSDGAGAEALTLNATGVIDMTTALTGGTSGDRSNVVVSAANQNVKLGDVTALSLTGLNNQAGNIALGAVTVTGDLNLRSTSGSLSATGITASDAVVGGPVSDVTLQAQTTLAVTGNATVEGDYAVTAGTGVTLNGVQGAGGKVTVQGATLTGNSLSLTSDTDGDTTTGDAAGSISITANGGVTFTGNTQLNGSVVAGSLTDVSVSGAANGTGDVTVTGNVVKLSAITTTGSIDIAADDSIGGVTATAPNLKATGADTFVKARAVNGVTVGAVEAGNGSGATPPSPQIELEGTFVTAGDVNARDGDADLHATDGDVTAVSVAAKGNITIQADVAVATAAHIRIGSVTTTNGDVALTADTGDITGQLASDRLSATAGGEGSTVTVSASTGKANLGSVTAGTGTALSAVTDQVSVTANEIDVTSANAQDGDVTLTTQLAGTSIIVGSAEAERHVDIDAATTATAGNLTSHQGDITIAAAQAAKVTGNVTAGSETGATGNYTVTGSTIELGATSATVTQAARGLVRVHATSDIDGRGALTLASDSDNAGQEPILLESDSGEIAFSGTSLLKGGTARHSKVGIFMGDASQDLTLGGIQARGLYNLDNTEAFLTDLSATGNVTLGDTSVRNTLTITTSGDITALGKVVVTGTGQGLFLDGAAITANGDLAAQGNVGLNANTISATNIYSNRNIAASGGSLDADLVQALGDVNDTTATGSVTAITAGTAAPAPYTADLDADTGTGGGVVTNCCDATPVAPGVAAGAGDIVLTKDTVDVGTLSAVQDILVTSGLGSVTMTSGTAGRDVIVTAETFADIGSLTATNRDLSITAGDAVSATNGAIDVATATAGRDISLSARSTSDASATTNGHVTAGTVTANRAVLIENTDRGGTVGDIEIATALKASDTASVDGDATVKSRGNVRLASLSAKRGNIGITAAKDITGVATIGSPVTIDDFGRGDVTAGVVGNTATKDKTVLIQSTGGRVKLGAISAGDGNATASTGATQITVSGLGADMTSVTARDGGLVLEATGSQDLVAGTVTAADGIAMQSVQGIRTNTVTSDAGDIQLTADTGDISGTGGLSTATGLTASGESRSITISAVSGTARLGDVSAGTGSASATVQPDQVKVTASAIDFGTAKAWARDGGLTLEATNGDLVLGEGEARSDASVMASGTVRLGDLHANEGSAVIDATGGDVTGLASGTPPTTFGHANVSAGTDIDITSGGASQLGTLSAGRNVEVAATGAADIIGDVTAGSTVSGGGYDVRGQSVTLGKTTAGPVTQKATGLVRVTATGGNVTGRNDLVLTSDSDASAPHGAPMLLEAGNGAIAFDAGTTIQGGADRTGRVGIVVGAGQNLTLGTVNARAIDGLSGAPGSETFATGLTVQGNVTLGAVSVRNGLSITTTGGDITTGGITVSGAGQGLTLIASGAGKDVTANADVVSQGNLTLQAGRHIAIANANSKKGNAILTAGGDISVTDLSAAGKVTQTAAGRITASTVASGLVTPNDADAGDPSTSAASGAIGTLALPVGATAATPAADALPVLADAHVAIDAQAIEIGSAIAARDLTLASRSDIRIDTATATSGSVTITADTGDISGRAISPAGDGRLLEGFGRTLITAQGQGRTVTVTATSGHIQTGAVTAGDGSGAVMATDQVVLTAGKAIDAVSANGIDAKDGGVTVLAQDGGIATTKVKARGKAKLTTQKAVAPDSSLRIDSVTTVDGGIELSVAGDISGTAATPGLSDFGRATVTAGGAGSTILASASGNALLDDVSAGTGTLNPTLPGKQVTVSAAGIDVGSVVARDGGVSLTATVSDIEATAVTVATGVTLLADGHVRTDSVTAAGGDISVTATKGDISGLRRTAPAGDGRLLADFNRMDVSAEASGGDIDLQSGGDVQSGALEAGNGLTVAADKNIDVVSAMSGGNLAVEAAGGDVRVNMAGAGGTATLTATGDATVGTLLSGGAASISAGQAVGINTIESTGGDLIIKGGSVFVTKAKAGAKLAADALNGDLTVLTGDADTTVRLNASGNVEVASLTSGSSASLTAGQTVDADLIESTGADVSLKGAAVKVGTVTAKTTLVADAAQGDLDLSSGQAGGSATLTANGNASVNSLRSGDAASVTAGQAASAIMIESTGANIVIKGASATAGSAKAGTTLAMEATQGALKLNDGQAGGSATLTSAGAVNVRSLVSGDAASVTAGQAVAIDTITSTNADLSVKGSAVNVTAAKAGSKLAIEATAGDAVLDNGDAAGSSDVKASGNATIQVYLRGGGTATVAAGGNVQAGDIRSTNGDVLITGATISATTANAGGALKMSAGTGGLSLGAGTAAGAALLESTGATGDVAVTTSLTAKGVTVKAAGDARLAPVTSTGTVIVTAANLIRTEGIAAAGQAVTLDARDADISGDVTGKTITVAARRTMRLGSNAAGSAGFDLSETEINRLKASGGDSQVALDAGANDVAIGDLDWTLTDPGTTAAIFTTARIDLTGRLTTDDGDAAATRDIILGGSATDPAAMATVIRLAATPAAGGRIDVGGATLELRGGAIAAGQAEGFLDDLGVNAGDTLASADVVAVNFVNQPNSTLYRSRVAYSEPILVRSGSIRLKYATFALFQNTGQGATNLGTSIGTATVPGTIEIDPVSPPNAFAMFGEINGVVGSASALLGQNVIKIGAGASIQNTRVNGCVVGAATACLSSSLVQPPLTVFDNSNIIILTAAAPDLSFDSVLSSNNEALFSDIAAPASSMADDTCDPTVSQCPTGSERGTEQ